MAESAISFSGMTFAEAQAKARMVFKRQDYETPDLDARLLLENASAATQAELISKSRSVLPEETAIQFAALVHRRVCGEPVHRILQFRDFFGRKFRLSSETLVPRPDTEILVEQVLGYCKSQSRPFHLLEIGTGAGIIAISLGAECRHLEITATDVSRDALATARQNADMHIPGGRVKFLHSDLFANLEGKFDAIVSNPPYIPTNDLAGLQTEVVDHDPVRALDGGADGLDYYREIFDKGRGFLKSGGMVFVEIGIGQKDDVCGIAASNDYTVVDVACDLSGLERVVVSEIL